MNISTKLRGEGGGDNYIKQQRMTKSTFLWKHSPHFQTLKRSKQWLGLEVTTAAECEWNQTHWRPTQTLTYIILFLFHLTDCVGFSSLVLPPRPQMEMADVGNPGVSASQSCIWSGLKCWHRPGQLLFHSCGILPSPCCWVPTSPGQMEVSSVLCDTTPRLWRCQKTPYCCRS